MIISIDRTDLDLLLVSGILKVEKENINTMCKNNAHHFYVKWQNNYVNVCLSRPCNTGYHLNQFCFMKNLALTLKNDINDDKN